MHELAEWLYIGQSNVLLEGENYTTMTVHVCVCVCVYSAHPPMVYTNFNIKNIETPWIYTEMPQSHPREPLSMCRQNSIIGVDWPFHSTTCAVHIEDCDRGLVVVQLLWLSGRALAAQAKGVLGSTPGDCRLFHFPLFSPHKQCEARCSEQITRWLLMVQQASAKVWVHLTIW